MVYYDVDNNDIELSFRLTSLDPEIKKKVDLTGSLIDVIAESLMEIKTDDFKAYRAYLRDLSKVHMSENAMQFISDLFAIKNMVEKEELYK